MSPSAPPAAQTVSESLRAQGFDVVQRLAVIIAVSEHLARRGCRTAADVGGHHGLLADHLPRELRCRAVVDLTRCERPDHVRGSALTLPLRDGAVDVALCADTLEHVADPLAAARELRRVAQRAVVISAPWKSEATDQAEEAVVRWHRQITGQDHPWLAEHRAGGLPDRDAITDILRGAGWHTAELACGTLAEWTLHQTARLIADFLPADHLDLDAFERACNEHWSPTLTTQLPAQPYRTVLIAAADASLLEGLADASPTPPELPTRETLSLLDGLVRALQEMTASSSDPDRLDADRLAQLEALTRQQAAEIDHLRRRAPTLFARLRRLIGRGAP